MEESCELSPPSISTPRRIVPARTGSSRTTGAHLLAHLFTVNYDERRPADEIFQAHREWGRRFQQKFDTGHGFVDRDLNPKRKLRIGYLSPDLGQHPVGFFSIDIFGEHDPETVEMFLYSNRHPETGDDQLSQRFRSLVGDEHWRWTRGLVDRTAEKPHPTMASTSSSIWRGIPGTTDLTYSRHAPPHSVSWLGYPNTTGLETVDYRLSDAITEPEGDADRRSTEQIYRLPKRLPHV